MGKRANKLHFLSMLWIQLGQAMFSTVLWRQLSQRKCQLIEAIRFASAVAAMKCTQAGGRAGIPNRAQTESFLSLYA